MEDSLESKLICRICLKVVDQTKQSYGNIEDDTGTLRDMMLCCIPEMVCKNAIFYKFLQLQLKILVCIKSLKIPIFM